MTLAYEQEKEFFSTLKDIFDFSTLPENDPFYNKDNSMKIGIFKDEVPGRIIGRFLTTGPKSYVYMILDMSGIEKKYQSRKMRQLFKHVVKLKGIPKYFQNKLLGVEDFDNSLDNPYATRALTYKVLRMTYERQMCVMTCTKRVLNVHDSKRWVYKKFRDSLALGHVLTLGLSDIELNNLLYKT